MSKETTEGVRYEDEDAVATEPAERGFHHKDTDEAGKSDGFDPDKFDTDKTDETTETDEADDLYRRDPADPADDFRSTDAADTADTAHTADTADEFHSADKAEPSEGFRSTDLAEEFRSTDTADTAEPTDGFRSTDAAHTAGDGDVADSTYAGYAAADEEPVSDTFSPATAGTAGAVGTTATAAGSAGTAATEPLLSSSAADDFLARWSDVQAAFIEDPHRSVAEADSLLSEVLTAYQQAVEERRARISGTGNADAADTENLRLALLDYRGIITAMLPSSGGSRV